MESSLCLRWVFPHTQSHLSRFIIVGVSRIGLLVLVNHPGGPPDSFTASSAWRSSSTQTRNVSSERLRNSERSSTLPFLGRPRPLPVLDLRSLVATFPLGLCGSPPASSPDSEKDSLVELREVLRWRRLALAFSRASCSAFS